MASRPRAEHFRILVVIFKLISGSLELATGTLLLLFSTSSLRSGLNSLVTTERQQDPNDPVVRFVELHLVPLISHKEFLAAGLVALGVVKIVGAVGLLKRRPWAYYMLVTLLIVILPPDAIHLITDFTVFSGVLVALNVAILAILLVYRRQLIAREEGLDLDALEVSGAA
jgi:uncharacterized membrane protein